MGRILHLSDIHFGGENVEAVAAVRDLALRETFDLIAITGDVTSYGSQPEFDAAAAWINALPHRKLVTPGNHDTPWAGMVSRLVAPFGRYEHCFGPGDFGAVDLDGLSARAFNTARGIQLRTNWSKGAASRKDVQRVVESFNPGPSLRIVLCHHPLTEITGGPMTGEVHGGDKAVEMLAAGQADLILTGHVHTPFVHPLPQGDGKTWAIGAGTLSLRERGAPAGYNVLEWDDRSVMVQAQGWTGSGFEAQRTWSIDRRIRA
ncbi:MAG: metallophosphoesterase [Caulobacteraceae bacterium]|nr:MAG: metallophosphoesterase [Caulobacteraceae bacterium]